MKLSACGRQLSGYALVALLLATACAPAASTSPTAAPAKPAEAAKPTPAAAKPADAAKPAEAKPAASPVAAALPAPVDPKTLSGTVKVDGSSTVFPVTEAMAEEFQKATDGKTRVTVGISGTGGGFKKFCAGETDISDASRPITKAELEACQAANIQFVELPVAFDGISIVTSPRNDFVDTMTVAELKKMWEPEAQGNVTKWSQIRPGWPDRPFKLYGAGTDSGTFDYFTDAINGKEKASRGDYTASEDDNVLVQGIANDPDALGYFGYAYYEQNKDKLKLVKVDGEKGGGPIAPAPDTIADGSYAPLSRPIFIYARTSALDRPEVREFVRYYLNPKNASTFIPQVGYVPFPETYYQQGLERLNSKLAGTVFAGAPALGVKLEDLFSRTPQ
jgi:phosphate transport system substrate-binding protein